jgi:hypothetical protein
MHETFWSIKLSDIISMAILIATILAIYYGPIHAVETTRKNDIDREGNRRRREIFAALMRTRSATLTPDHVWALNLIQVEFVNDPDVIRAYRDYIEKLSEEVPEAGSALEAFLQRRRDRFFDLLHEIAKVVGFSLDKRDLERAAYVPVGWENEQTELRLFRRAILELLHGQRGLPVMPFSPQGTQSPFPPPPETVTQTPANPPAKSKSG